MYATNLPRLKYGRSQSIWANHIHVGSETAAAPDLVAFARSPRFLTYVSRRPFHFFFTSASV